MQKRNSSTKNGTVTQKTEQWYKNTLFRFVLLWTKRNRSAKNGTVVQKHTVQFFVPLWKKRNSGAKNGTVVLKHTFPFFVLLWEKTEQKCKKRNSGTKTHCSVVCSVVEKNGTVVQKTEHWYKKHTVPFWSVVENTEQKCKKWNSGTKTHCSVFCSVVEKREQWSVLFCCGKNGTEVQKTEQWYKNTLFRFLFRCGKKGTAEKKN